VPSPLPLPRVKDLNNDNEVSAYITAALNPINWYYYSYPNDEALTEFARFMNDSGMIIISAQLSNSEQHLPDESEYIQSQIYQYFSSYLTAVKV
jgi:hypothetical protein